MLKNINTTEVVLNKVVELIDDKNLDSEDLKSAALLFYKKLKAAFFYKPEKYDGDIVLLKAKDSFVPLNNDYGLSKVIITFTHKTLIY